MPEAQKLVRISVDKTACVGSGACAMTAPENFELRDGKAQVKMQEAPLTEALDDAVLDCPVQAILREDVG